jgi:hypothetical protein
MVLSEEKRPVPVLLRPDDAGVTQGTHQNPSLRVLHSTVPESTAKLQDPKTMRKKICQ